MNTAKKALQNKILMIQIWQLYMALSQQYLTPTEK